MLGPPTWCRLAVAALVPFNVVEILGVQPHARLSGDGRHVAEAGVLRSDESQSLDPKELEAFAAESRDKVDGVARKVQATLSAHVSKVKEALRQSREKFRVAVDKISQDSARRAKKIEDRMQALSVAQCHGKYNDQKSVMPMGKCCCSKESEADVGEPSCEWFSRSAMEDHLECPSHHKLEYTDLIQVQTSNSSRGPAYIEASQIEKNLAACVKSTGWKERMQNVQWLPDVLVLPTSNEASSPANDKMVPKLLHKLDAILERASASPVVQKNEILDSNDREVGKTSEVSNELHPFKAASEQYALAEELDEQLQRSGGVAGIDQASRQPPSGTQENQEVHQSDAELHPMLPPSDKRKLVDSFHIDDQRRSLLELNRSSAATPDILEAALTPRAALIKSDALIG